MMYLPKRYWPYVTDFYRDCDGWWICLRNDGPYILDGYASDYTIHEDTQTAAVAAFREYVKEKGAK